MQPIVVLLLLPLAIGAGFEFAFRDTKRATLAAAVVSPLVVYFCIDALDPGGTWNWLATFLVAPLAIGCSLAAVLISFGRRHAHRRYRHDA
jgi:hypothetical protein